MKWNLIRTDMSTFLLFVLIAWTCTGETAYSENYESGSGVEITTLSAVQTVNLVTMGKVWGFLKYHHPRISSGKVPWDDELFRILPGILEAANGPSANVILLDWTKGLGSLRKGKKCAANSEDLHLQPDLDWIRDHDALGRPLCTYLQKVYKNRQATGHQFYVSMVPGVGNPDFSPEKAYEKLSQPDAGYRILALYRFWNIIQYWFPYRDLIEEDWDGVLAEFLPRLVAAKTADSYKRELIAFIARVHDTHANLWSSLEVMPPQGPCQLPLRMRFIEDRAVVAGFLHPVHGPAAGFKIGDVIVRLDGKSVSSLIAEWSPYYPASNEPTRLREIAKNLTRGAGGHCRVEVERAGESLELRTDRMPHRAFSPRNGGNNDFSRRFHDLPGDTFRLLSRKVAYLKLSSVKASEAAKYIKKAQGTKGLIIDIRNYPSEFVVFALGGFLVKNETPFVRFTMGDLSNPGAFIWSDPLKLNPKRPYYKGQIAILVDEITQSQAEYTAMAFRSGSRAKVLGSTTAGADGNVSTIPLPGGLRTMISGIGVFYPDKTPTQRVGIVPDIEVRPTIEGIRAGRDEVLEAALRLILGGQVSEEEIRRMAKGESQP